jgi:hypothetical protein
VRLFRITCAIGLRRRRDCEFLDFGQAFAREVQRLVVVLRQLHVEPGTERGDEFLGAHHLFRELACLVLEVFDADAATFRVLRHHAVGDGGGGCLQDHPDG